MAIMYGSDEWAKALCQELNKSQAYKEAAKNWEGDLYFMVEPREPWLEGFAMYFDLWHGECREACVVAEESDRSPKYRIWAPYSVWKQIMEKKLDGVQAMMTGKLSMQGEMAQVMKMPRATTELTNCSLLIDTEFPQ